MQHKPVCGKEMWMVPLHSSTIGNTNEWQPLYLSKHRPQIVNYAYYQAKGISIGSGAVESTVKQIGRRIKLSGAQWEKDNVPQVLKQRSAYLNGQFSKWVLQDWDAL